MNKGFTILELLVVISVLVILIGVGVPRIKGMKDAASIVQVKKELQTLQAATESYYINNRSSYIPNTGAFSTQSIYLTSQAPNIINTVLIDPFSNTSAAYGYGVSSNMRYYVWFSVGLAGSGAVATIDNSGVVTKTASNVLCITNGSGC